jgi:drug/metabolite transporter (DMT)-like permease
MRLRPPRDWAVWAHSGVVAVLLNTIPFPLFAFGETKISSVLAGVWNATAPLATLAFALVLLPDERPNRRRLAGMVVGFSGVLVVLGVWRGIESGPLVGTLACLGATTCYGAGFTYTRRFLSGRTESAGALSAAQVTWATVQLALVAPALNGAPTWPGGTAMAALFVLGAVGTGLAYQVNLTVIRTVGSTVAASVTYLTPVVSTALGAVLLAEPVGSNTAVGALLIILGVAVSSGRAARRSPAPLPARQPAGSPVPTQAPPDPGRS